MYDKFSSNFVDVRKYIPWRYETEKYEGNNSGVLSVKEFVLLFKVVF